MTPPPNRSARAIVIDPFARSVFVRRLDPAAVCAAIGATYTDDGYFRSEVAGRVLPLVFGVYDPQEPPAEGFTHAQAGQWGEAVPIAGRAVILDFQDEDHRFQEVETDIGPGGLLRLANEISSGIRWLPIA